MAKRANKEGTFYQLPSGNWRVQIRIDNRRLSHTGTTKGDCREWLRKITDENDANSFSKEARLTLQEYISSWLINIQTSIRPGTYYQYKMTFYRHIDPSLGSKRLVDITPECIQDLYTGKLRDGIGCRTVEMIHAVLHRSFSQAVKLGILPRNPVDATTPPRVESKEMHFYDEDQVNELLLAARGNRNEALYHLAIVTGMRQSELLGAKWSDLDWNKRTLFVQRQLKRKFKQGDYFSQPKTKNGRRTITLGEITMAIMKVHYQKQGEERMVAGQRWQDNDLIFPTSIGTPKNQSNLYREFKEFAASIGLPPIRFHDLRHTAATLLLNHGIPAIIVSRRLGHHKVSMTLDIYGHLIPEMQEDAANLIDELITSHPVALPTITHEDNVFVDRGRN